MVYNHGVLYYIMATNPYSGYALLLRMTVPCKISHVYGKYTTMGPFDMYDSKLDKRLQFAF